MKYKKSFLVRSVLASTIFCLFPAKTIALNPVAVSQNTNSVADLTGYDIIANNVTLTVLDGANIGTTGVVSIDNNNSGIFCGFGACTNSVVNFASNATVQGRIGSANPIDFIQILGGAGTTVLLQGNITVSNRFDFAAGSTATTNVQFGSGVSLSGLIGNTSGSPNVGNVLLNGGNSITGTIGVVGNPINSIQLLGGTDTFQSEIRAKTINFAALNVVLNFDPLVATVTADIDSSVAGNSGKVNITGGLTLNGNIGVTNGIGTVNIDVVGPNAVRFNLANATINPGTGGINFIGGSTATTELDVGIGNTVNGNINNLTGNNNVGRVIAEDGATFNGFIGGAGATQKVNIIELHGATANFNGDINVGPGNLIFTAGNQTANFANGTTITINGNIDNPGGFANDQARFFGNATINGTIGATNPLSAVTLETAGKTVTFTNTVDADAINFASAASTTSTFDIQNGVVINGKIDNTTGTAGIGTVIFEGNNNYAFTIGQTKSVFAVTTSDPAGGNVTFQDIINATNVNVLGVNSTVDFQADVNATTINLDGSGSTTTFDDNVTATTLNVSGPGAKAIFNDNVVNIPTLNFSGAADINSTMQFADNVDVPGKIDNITLTNDIGTVFFEGDSKVTGTIGATKSVHQILLDGANTLVDFFGNINVGTGDLEFTNNADNNTTARIQNNVTITGNVDSQAAGTGTLHFAGSSTITGTIGATKSLAEVKLTKAGSLVLFGGSILNATPINFYANATANFAQGVTVDGKIDNLTGGTPSGTIQFLGDATVNGQIGATDGFIAINILGQDKTVVFNNDILNDTPIIFLADGAASIEDGQTIFDVDNFTGGVAGTLILQGGANVEDVGATTPLKLISVNTDGGIKTVNFTGGELNAETINVVGAGGTTINLKNAAAGMNVFGNFTTNNNGIDIISVEANGNVTIDGSVGTSTNRYGQFNLNKAATTTLIFGDIYANNIQFQQANTTLKIEDGFSAFGPIKTAIAGEGGVTFLGNSTIGFNIGAGGAQIDNVTINGPVGTTVTLNADVFADTFLVNNGGTLSVSGTPTVTADVDIANGVLSMLPNSVLNVNGDFTLNTAPAILKLDMAHSLTATGHVVATGQAFVKAPGNLQIVNPGFSPNKATVIPIVNGGAGSVLAPLNIITPNSFLTTFTTQVNPGNPNELDLIITSQSLANVADQTNTIGVGGALDQIATSGVPLSGTLAAIIAELNAFPDAATLNFALSTLAPLVDGAVTQESFMAQRMVFDSIADRVDREHFWERHQKPKEKSKGLSAGDSEHPDSSGWVRVFHLHANQQKREKIEGYKDDMWGLVVGGDTMPTENYMVGAAFSWATLDLQHKLLPWMKTRINSYQATVYGSLEWECPWYVNGAASLAYNDYETHRHISFGSVSVFPVGDYHGWQTGFTAESGYIFGHGNFHAIPLANVFYSHLNLSSYRESGADTADQVIQSSNFNSLVGGVGLKLTEDYAANYQRVFQSEIHGMAFYGFINDRMETTSHFVGAGPDFNTLGFKPPHISYNVGASLSLFSKANWTFKAGYDFELKEDYRAHAGQIRARYDW